LDSGWDHDRAALDRAKRRVDLSTDGGCAVPEGYIEEKEYPKYLRPESAEVRKAILQTIHDELKDLEVQDVDLFDEEAERTC